MNTCTLVPVEKRKLGREVGRELALKFGRKPYYSRLEIKRVMRRLAFPDTWDCWAFSLYLSHSDFDAHHAAIGEICDYTSMREGMVEATLGGLPSGFDADFSWLDWTGFDISGLFDAPDIA
ncbi:MAG: hypothetical protein ABIQ70_14005 [Dokdonella sp.]